ncbi:MAG: hypothetical protein WC052_00560 [Patescibacteria group bacterium]|jgi:hypothetical protein
MEEQTDTDRKPVRFQWVVPEYHEYDRSREWYIVAGLCALFFLGIAIWYQNFLGAVLVLILTIIVVAQHGQTPIDVAVELREDGIQIGSAFFHYRDLQSFWFIYEPPDVKTLYFDFRSQWRVRLPVPLQDMDPVAIRAMLLQYLEENLEREAEPTSDSLSRWLQL